MKNSKGIEKKSGKVYNVSGSNFAAYADFFEKNDLEELIIEEKGTKIEFRKAGAMAPQTIAVPAVQSVVAAQPAAAPQAAPAAHAEAPAAAPAAVEDNGNFEKVLSPLNGSFYSAASPDTPPFVSVGSVVSPGTVLCIVEAMKIFNEIKSDVSGKVSKILVKNGDAVKEDQVLFLIEPA